MTVGRVLDANEPLLRMDVATGDIERLAGQGQGHARPLLVGDRLFYSARGNALAALLLEVTLPAGAQGRTWANQHHLAFTASEPHLFWNDDGKLHRGSVTGASTAGVAIADTSRLKEGTAPYDIATNGQHVFILMGKGLYTAPVDGPEAAPLTTWTTPSYAQSAGRWLRPARTSAGSAARRRRPTRFTASPLLAAA
jgi:hypothetical protein